MDQQARVNSVITLKELRSALAKFGETASLALEEAGSDIQRTLTWLNEDRRRHWKNQVRLRQERYVQAKLALKRKGIFDLALAGVRSSAIDEKKALAIAERQLREAERRLSRTKSWILQLERELSDYRAATQGLATAVDMDIPNARARLEKMVESLEAYIALAPPETIWSPEELARANVLQREGAPSTGQPPSPGARWNIADLRRRTPSLEVRRKATPDAKVGDWIANIEPSEALARAIHDTAIDMSPPRPDDKVVLAQPQGEPGIVYLERVVGDEDDSGWYIGIGDEIESSGCTAARSADLIQQCPGLEEMLSLPSGYAIVIDVTKKTEALFDPENNILGLEIDNEQAATEAPTPAKSQEMGP